MNDNPTRLCNPEMKKEIRGKERKSREKKRNHWQGKREEKGKGKKGNHSHDVTRGPIVSYFTDRHILTRARDGKRIGGNEARAERQAGEEEINTHR